MKKSRMLRRMAALAVASVGPAFAQSSDGPQVQVYGRIDVYAGTERSNIGSSDGGSSNVVNSGGQSGSRWGLRGSESLGGGLRARFTLEGGFNADDGTLAQGGRLFGREATVGLAGGFGSVDLGRRDSAYYDFRNGFVATISTAEFDPVTRVFAETNPANVTITGGVRTSGTSTSSTIANTAIDGSSISSPGDFTTRVSNNIHYQSPNLGGLRVGVGYSFGEDKRTVAGTAGKPSSVISANVTYDGGKWDVGAAIQQENFRSSITTAGLRQGEAEKQVLAIGARYKFSFAEIAAMVNFDEFKPAVGASEEATEYAVGLRVPYGNFTFNAMYAYGKIDGVSNNASGWGAQLLYAFTRRTDVYLAHRTNSDDNIPTTGATVRTARVTDSLTGLGLRHRF